MVGHFNKRQQCINICSQDYSREALYALSVQKRYHFHIDINDLKIKDYLFLATHYTEDNNYIYDNFLEKVTPDSLPPISPIPPLRAENSNEQAYFRSEGKRDNPERKKSGKQATRYQCSRCFSVFTSRDSLLYHTEETPEKIKYCEKKLLYYKTVILKKREIEKLQREPVEGEEEGEEGEKVEELKERRHLRSTRSSSGNNTQKRAGRRRIASDGDLEPVPQMNPRAVHSAHHTEKGDLSANQVDDALGDQSAQSARTDEQGEVIEEVSIHQTVSNPFRKRERYSVVKFINDIYDYSHLSPEILSTDFYVVDKFLEHLFQNNRNRNIFMKENGKEIAFIHGESSMMQIRSDMCVYLMIISLKYTVKKMLEEYGSEGNYDYILKYYETIQHLYLKNMQFYIYNHVKRVFELPLHKNMIAFRSSYQTLVESEIEKITDDVIDNFGITGRRYTNINTITPALEGYVPPREIDLYREIGAEDRQKPEARM